MMHLIVLCFNNRSHLSKFLICLSFSKNMDVIISVRITGKMINSTAGLSKINNETTAIDISILTLQQLNVELKVCKQNIICL